MTRGRSKPGTLAAMKAEGWFGLLLVVAFSFFLNVLVLASPIYSMQVFDRAAQPKPIHASLPLHLHGGSSRRRARHPAAGAGAGADRALVDERTREPVLKASVLATLRVNPATHGLQDVGTVRGFIVSSAPLPLFDAPWTPVFLVVLAVLNPLIGLLAAATALLLLALAVANDVTTRRASAGVEAQMQLANFAHVAIRHADTIQAMGMQGALCRRYGERNGIDPGGQSAGGRQLRRPLGSLQVPAHQRADRGDGAGGLARPAEQADGGRHDRLHDHPWRALAPVEQAIGAWRNLVAAIDAYRRTRQLLEITDAQEDVIALPSPAGHLGSNSSSTRRPTPTSRSCAV